MLQGQLSYVEGLMTEPQDDYMGIWNTLVRPSKQRKRFLPFIKHVRGLRDGKTNLSPANNFFSLFFSVL